MVVLSNSITAVMNQKGGVGKTTTALYLGRLLKDMGGKVLLVDADPQANLSKLCGIEEAQPNLSHMLQGQSVEDVVHVSEKYDIEIVPSHLIDVSNAATGVMTQPEKNPLFRFSMSLNRVRNLFTHILIDCPPSTGILAMSALVAADTVIIPTETKELSVDGVKQTLKILGEIQENTGKEIEYYILPTMVDLREIQQRKSMRALLDMGVDTSIYIPQRGGQNADDELMVWYSDVMEKVYVT